MKRLSVFLISFALLSFAGATVYASDTVRVKRVVGVDAFETEDGSTIGLLGITLPNGEGASVAECVAHLRSLIEGRVVVVVVDTTVADVSGTNLQRLVYLDGELINLRMISDGYARPSSTAHLRSASFASAHSTARSGGVGAFAPKATTSESSGESAGESSSVQCSGRTKKGTRCKRMTKSPSGRCYQH